MICDFCSTPDPKHEFKVDSFQVTLFSELAHVAPGDQAWISEGSWWACDTCATLVRARDEEGLFRRSVELLHIEPGAPMMAVKMGHKYFFEILKS